MDVEGATGVSRKTQTVDNPFSNHPEALAQKRFIDKVQRILYIVISAYALHYFKFYGVILRSPHVRHEWFKVGLALTIAILTIKAYVELYEKSMKKAKVNYENFRQTTHAILIMLILSSLAFNIALWPHYGWNSPILLGIFFYGCVINFLLLVPTWLQNAVAFVGLTFFLQEYK